MGVPRGRTNNKTWLGVLVLSGGLASVCPPADAADAKSLERGRYLVQLGGCNDCHTANFADREGKIPQSQWLMGDRIGWYGPWGTTYPANLRLFFSRLGEDDWVRQAHKAQYRPPMPSYMLRDLKDQDLRDIYRFIRHLGPAGSPAPAYVAAGHPPAPPYMELVVPAADAASAASR